MPPLHPSLVHFPIALITLAVIAECVGYFRNSPTARAVGWWALVGAAVGGVLTVAAGYWDMGRAALTHETHELVHVHLKVGWALFAAIGALTVWRAIIRTKRQDTPGTGYLIAALLVLALTFFQGWFGGELAYAHGAGVAAAGQGMRPAEQAKENARAVATALGKLPMMGQDEEEGAGEDDHSGEHAGQHTH
jgi:uncharacterized membrane protein